MKTRTLLYTALSLMIGLSACQSQNQSQSEPQLPEYCTVKGSVKGLKNGTKLELQDQFDHYKIIATAKVKDGAYEFHPRISAPTHVYLYTRKGKQLKDFFLEPGTILADVDATDMDDMDVCGTGTPSNDLLFRIHQLRDNGEEEAAQALLDEALQAEQTGVLALYFADNQSYPAAQGLRTLDHLSPDLADKPYLAELRDNLERRVKVEPAPEGSEMANRYIDMTYADVNGNPVSLSSVVDNPANRCVLLDFWATWCGPCVESIPNLQALYAKYHDKGLEIYSVSEDPYEEEWKTFLSKTDMPWIQVLDDKPGRESQAKKDYVFTGIPMTVLIDGETGAILMRDNARKLDSFLSELLP